MKRWFVDACIGGALLGSLTLNVALCDEPTSSEPASRVVRRAHSIHPRPRPPPRANCNESLNERTQGAARVNGTEEPLHHSFARESRDSTWATTQEGILDAHFAELLAPHRFDLTVECRMRCCEFSGDDVDWGLVASEMQTSAGLLGWATEMSFSDHIVACFDRKTAMAAPTNLVRRRNEIMAQLRQAFAKCAGLSSVSTVVMVKLGVDTDGSVRSSTRAGELSGSESARCVEKQLVDKARFDPRVEPALVQFVVALTPIEDDSR